MRGKLPEYLLKLCRDFRKHPTETEAMLWECLRNSQLHDYKFRRQHPIGRYIADFYCDELKLVVEIDGSIHDQTDQAEYDMVRQRELEDQGYTIVRVTADAVKNHLVGILVNLIPLSPRERG
jgi:very-short-patch-repair endonuclease